MTFLNRPEILPWFVGKSVAIVGSGPGCLRNPIGFVDSHDVVIRVNNYKLFPETGFRADVFYSFFGLTIRKSPWELRRDGVGLCMNKYPNAECIESDWHRRKGKRRGIDFTLIYKEREDWWWCPTYVPSVHDFMSDFEMLGKRVPTTGFSAIMEVLRMIPESIYLTGFDFFASGLHNVDEKWANTNSRDPIGHDPQGERAWLRENWHKYPFSGDDIVCDSLSVGRTVYPDAVPLEGVLGFDPFATP